MEVLMENTSYELVVGNSQMPFVNSLVASNGSVSTSSAPKAARMSFRSGLTLFGKHSFTR